MNNIKTINGTDFVKILFLAKDLIFNTKDQINQLNVFPAVSYTHLRAHET